MGSATTRVMQWVGLMVPAARIWFRSSCSVSGVLYRLPHCARTVSSGAQHQIGCLQGEWEGRPRERGSITDSPRAGRGRKHVEGNSTCPVTVCPAKYSVKSVRGRVQALGVAAEVPRGMHAARLVPLCLCLRPRCAAFGSRLGRHCSAPRPPALLCLYVWDSATRLCRDPSLRASQDI